MGRLLTVAVFLFLPLMCISSSSTLCCLSLLSSCWPFSLVLHCRSFLPCATPIVHALSLLSLPCFPCCVFFPFLSYARISLCVLPHACYLCFCMRPPSCSPLESSFPRASHLPKVSPQVLLSLLSKFYCEFVPLLLDILPPSFFVRFFPFLLNYVGVVSPSYNHSSHVEGLSTVQAMWRVLQLFMLCGLMKLQHNNQMQMFVMQPTTRIHN